MRAARRPIQHRRSFFLKPSSSVIVQALASEPPVPLRRLEEENEEVPMPPDRADRAGAPR